MRDALLSPFADVEPISTYTRAQAIEDGVLVDAQVGELADVTRQHLGTTPCALSAGVFALIERAVQHPRHCNDWRGVWHDILWMSQFARQVSGQREGSPVGFKVIITGTGRIRNHVLYASTGPGDSGEPVVTIMEASDL